MGIELALLGGSALAAGASIYSGDEAADATRDGSRLAAQTQRYMYDQSRRDMAPYRAVGQSALNQLAAMYGIRPVSGQPYNGAQQAQAVPTGAQHSREGQYGGGDGLMGELLSDVFAQMEGQEKTSHSVDPAPPQYTGQAVEGEYVPAAAPDFSAFEKSPDYQFAYDQGMRATEQSLARRGLSGSGAAMKALTRFGQGLASQQLNNYTNRLASLAGVGQTATSQLSQLGHGTAQGVAQAQQNAADTRASSYLNRGQAIGGAINNITDFYTLKNMGAFS